MPQWLVSTFTPHFDYATVVSFYFYTPLTEYFCLNLKKIIFNTETGRIFSVWIWLVLLQAMEEMAHGLEVAFKELMLKNKQLLKATVQEIWEENVIFSF